MTVFQDWAYGDDSTTTMKQQEKRKRRTKKEMEEFLNLHAARRRVSKEEMSAFLQGQEKRRKRSKLIELGVTTESAAAPGKEDEDKDKDQMHIDVAFRELSASLMNYDISGCQSWIETYLSDHYIISFTETGLPTFLYGPRSWALYCSLVLGTFPVFQISEMVTRGKRDEHERSLEQARVSSSVYRDTLTLDNTAVFIFKFKFEGYRIFYQSLWDIMAMYVSKKPKFTHEQVGLVTEQDPEGMLNHMLHSDDCIFKDYDRKPNADRNGFTHMLGSFLVLTESRASKIYFMEKIEISTLARPELNDVDTY